MNGLGKHPLFPVRRSGFTLVELLVTVTIIGILAAAVTAGLVVARQAAREAATKATIAKLHNIIMAKSESYRTRRVPLTDQEIHRIAVGYYGLTPTQPTPPGLTALIRLRVLRDIMRMEMPERWTDVLSNPAVPLNISTVLIPAPHPDNPWLPNPNASPTPMPRTTLSQSFYARFQPIWQPIYNAENGLNVGQQTGLATLHQNAPAECLYMIVAAGGEEARRQFRTNEIGDTDNDSFPEILDGWGRPIFFLRWAPGFNDSDIQPNALSFGRYTELLSLVSTPVVPNAWSYYNSSDPMPPDPNASAVTLRQAASQTDHDPFDARYVDVSNDPTNAGDPPRGWRLVPLVYSAGPDGAYGLYSYPSDDSATATVNESWVWTWSEHPATGNSVSAYAMGWGLPIQIEGSWAHFDNIHNHHLEMR